MIDDIRDGVDALLHGEREPVVLCADGVGDLLGGGEVGRALEADRERLERLEQLRVAILEELLPPQPRDHRRDERRVEPTREQHAKWHVGHEALVDGSGERGADEVEVERRRRVRRVAPLRLVVLHHLVCEGRVVVAGREDVDVDAAGGDERLGLGGEPLGAVDAGAHIHRVDADRVARRVHLTCLLVQDHESKVTVELRSDVDADLVVEVHDDLAVRLGAEGCLLLQLGAQLLVVVNLAVDGQAALAVV
mmetsp:Transcript_40867/g.107994  ORF Transcript_40867/g.107994 Transcript_40867/m.107994 type:complete len:250 (-) Transcript_40867:331-1080(-)